MFLRRIIKLPKSQQNVRLATTAGSEQNLDSFRTAETNPSNLNRTQIGKFYRIDPDVKKAIFNFGGFPKKFDDQVKTFNESCLMVREPTVEIIDYIKQTDFNKPTTRYVLYGKDGVGKSLVLANLLHYGAVNDYILVHVPWVPNWFKKPKEKANSATKEGYLDINIDAAAWLIHFRAQNTALLQKLDLKCSKEYVWSIREVTTAGSTLLELIEHGINRIKYASDTIAVLLAELKQQSTEGKLRTMVAIDGYNAFFFPHTYMKFDNKQMATPDKITITAPFIDITNYDWCNGVCILAVDRMAQNTDHMDSELPRYLLGKNGFEHLDPFVPIRVDPYSDEEYQHCIDYYVNRRWLQNTATGFDTELKFLSNKNPYQLMELCGPL